MPAFHSATRGAGQRSCGILGPLIPPWAESSPSDAAKRGGGFSPNTPLQPRWAQRAGVRQCSGRETRPGSANPRFGTQRPRSLRGLNLGSPRPPRVPTSAPPHAPAPFTIRRTRRNPVPTHHGSVALSSRDGVLICTPGCCQGKRCSPSRTHHCHLSRGRPHTSGAPHLTLEAS